MQRQMLHATIVPERQRTFLPTEPTRKLWSMTPFHQPAEQRLAFLFRHVLKRNAVRVIDEQTFPARLRMRPNNRMRVARLAPILIKPRLSRSLGLGYR